MKEIEIVKHSGVYTLISKQVIDAPLRDVWDYFSNPGNLSRITPGDMHFRITSRPKEPMYAGMIITYKVKIFPLIMSNWVTEITHVETFKYFIDVQLFGPYKLWHHQHHFDEQENGVLMTDIVTFKIPYGIFGRIAGSFVKKKLKKIFAFRYAFIADKYNKDFNNDSKYKNEKI
jgi:ligand-binding SRPBCC domain-containing protein